MQGKYGHIPLLTHLEVYWVKKKKKKKIHSLFTRNGVTNNQYFFFECLKIQTFTFDLTEQ